MLLTAVSFLISGIFFFILSIFIKGIMIYCVPFGLVLSILLIIYIDKTNRKTAKKIINDHPNLFEDVEKDIFLSSPSVFLPIVLYNTLFVRFEPASAVGYIMIISVIYGLICIFIQNWIVVVICTCIFLYSIKSNIGSAFPVNKERLNIERIELRFLKLHVARESFERMDGLPIWEGYYRNILDKLKKLINKN